MLRLPPHARAQQPHHQSHEPGCRDLASELRIGRPGDGDELAATLEDAKRLFECLAILAVQHHVVVAQDILEVLRLVVDDDVRTQALHERDIGRAGRRGDGRAQMPGQLDGKGAHAAGACLDEDLLPLLQPGLLDERLPGRQGHQGNGSGFFHREAAGFQRQRGFLDRDEFSERADPQIVRSRIDLVPGLEQPHESADPDDFPGNVVAQDERHAVRQEHLEVAMADLGVEQVHPCGMDLDQDLVVAQLGRRHVGPPERALLSIPVENECFHEMS